MNAADRVERKPFKLRETVYRSDRYKNGCLCPGVSHFQKRLCRRCVGPFVVTMIKEVWPASQTGWVMSVKDKRSGEKYVRLDSSWFVRR